MTNTLPGLLSELLVVVVAVLLMARRRNRRQPTRETYAPHGQLAELRAFAVAVLLVAGALLLVGVVAVMWYEIGGPMISILLVACPPLAIAIGAVAAPLLSADVRAFRNVRRTGGVPRTAEWVSPSSAGGLRDLVAELALEMQTPAPTKLWLTSEANTSVYESRRFLRSPRHSRHLCIGVPLLVGLTTEQLRAVLCHELAHYARRHSFFSAMAYRGSAVLRSVLAELDQAALPTSDVATIDKMLRISAMLQRFGVFFSYAVFYDRVTLAVRRRHEYEADRIAATILGAEEMAEALRTAYALSAAWEDFRTHSSDLVPEEPFRAFALMLDDPAYRHTQEGTTSPLRPRPCSESHPYLEARLTALGQPSATGLSDTRPGSCLELLDSEPVLLARLARTAFPCAQPIGHLWSRAQVGHAEQEDTDSDQIPPCPGHTPRTDTLIKRRGRKSWSDPTAALFMCWSALLFPAKLIELADWAPSWRGMVTLSGIVLPLVTLIFVGVTQSREQETVDPTQPRQLRWWLELATAMFLTYAALVHFAFKGLNGVVVVAILMGLAVPLYLPRVKVPTWLAITACVLAMSAIGQTSHPDGYNDYVNRYSQYPSSPGQP